MSLDQLLDWFQKLGPSGIMALMWWFQRKDTESERAERLRLQRIVEGFLPIVEANARVNRALRRVVTGNGDTNDVGDFTR